MLYEGLLSDQIKHKFANSTQSQPALEQAQKAKDLKSLQQLNLAQDRTNEPNFGHRVVQWIRLRRPNILRKQTKPPETKQPGILSPKKQTMPNIVVKQTVPNIVVKKQTVPQTKPPDTPQKQTVPNILKRRLVKPNIAMQDWRFLFR